MIIRCTLREVLQYGDWEEFCKEKGWDYYAVAEDGGDIEVELTIQEAIKYGLIGG